MDTGCSGCTAKPEYRLRAENETMGKTGINKQEDVCPSHKVQLKDLGLGGRIASRIASCIASNLAKLAGWPAR